MIDDIVIDIWLFRNFVNIDVIRRKCNQMVDLLKYTSNKTTFSGVAIWLKKVHFKKNYKSTHNKDAKITFELF